MANLAILGHPTRGREVVELLEMLGGKNVHDYVCNVPGHAYIINKRGIIGLYISHPNSSFAVFTLEEFFEKYPYKVGDYVYINSIDYQGPGIIQNLYWCDNTNTIRYFVESNRCNAYWEVNELLLQKEQEITDTVLAPDLIGEDYSGRRFGYKIPKGYEFECVRNNEIILKPIKPQYPKTYEECCNVLGVNPSFDIRMLEDEESALYFKFIDLVRCRNAYWKLAGDWKIDFDSEMYYICNEYGEIQKSKGTTDYNVILAFPTEEMRDAFYENFKELIEQCKELL